MPWLGGDRMACRNSLTRVQARLDELVALRLERGLSGEHLAEYDELIALEAELLRERGSNTRD